MGSIDWHKQNRFAAVAQAEAIAGRDIRLKKLGRLNNIIGPDCVRCEAEIKRAVQTVKRTSPYGGKHWVCKRGHWTKIGKEGPQSPDVTTSV